MTAIPGAREVDPEAEAARLAEERLRCRFCDATAPIPLMHTAGGWQCLDGIDCFHRQPGEPGDG